MLRPRLVARLAAAARRSGLIARLTTGAAWARTPGRARRCLRPAATAGLSQVFLSAGEFHHEQQPTARLVHAAAAARDLGLQVYLALARTASGRRHEEIILAALRSAGLGEPPRYHQPLVAVGRGRDVVAPAHGDQDDGGGPLVTDPCPSLGRHPTLWPDGLWTGCASVGARQAPDLACGRLPRDGVAAALERLRSDPLWAWISGLGPSALARMAGSRRAAAGPCGACLGVLTDAGRRAAVRLRLPAPAAGEGTTPEPHRGADRR